MIRSTQRLALIAGIMAMSSSSWASEVQYGSGNMNLQGGFLGLETEINSPVTTYTLKEQHANIFRSDWFYNYQATYYSAQSLDSAGGLTSSGLGGDLLLDETDYELSGIDAQVTLGYDVYKRGPQDYVGFGVSLGIATPYLKNSGDGTADGDEESGSESATPVPFVNGGSATDIIASSTDFFGYKIGPKVMASKSFGEYASFFAEASYAWQTMNVENSTLNLDTNINGTYFSYGVGMRYQPISTKKDLGFMTIEPALYMTFGVNYAQLLMDDLNVDLSGNNYAVEDSELKMDSTTLYFGLGYAF